MTTTSTSGAETRDAFLGGRVMAWQPARGYRAGIDAVFLAAASPARSGEKVLELGCGVGVAALCLSARTSALVTGVERQPLYADFARRNGVDVVEADIAELPAVLRQRSFDHVILNPPFYYPAARLPGADKGREAAHAEDTPLATWIATARARLKTGGVMTMIHRAERLPDILSDLRAGWAAEVLPLAPRTGRKAKFILIRARKGGRAPFTLHSTLAIHAGAVHGDDAPDYAPWALAVLSDAAPLPWPA
ncbi:MAG: tRNA1(Val) (adenine(37)-N6)-methyltransferase [Shimia sp.]